MSESESFLSFLRYKTKLLTLDPKFHTNDKIFRFYHDASTFKSNIWLISFRHQCIKNISNARYFSRLLLFQELVVKLSLKR